MNEIKGPPQGLEDKLLYGAGDISMPPMPSEQPQPDPEPSINPIEPIEAPEDNQALQIAEPQAEAAPQENARDTNFRAMRERAGNLERERNEMAKRIAELEARSNRETQLPDEDDNFDIGADDLAEGKHLKKVANKIKKLEQQVYNYQQQSQTSSVEMQLKARYPDFDSVVSAENVETLRLAYPELATTLNSSSDLYSKAVSAYTLIKKLGIQPEDTFVADRAKAQVNAAKPRPLVSVSPQQGDSPLSRANAFANGLTDELKASLLKEMNEIRRGM